MSESLIGSAESERFLADLLNGDATACRTMVQDLLERGITVIDLYTNLFHRAQYTIGDLWAANRISVANEHLATAIIESLMTLVYPKLFRGERTGRSALVSCNANDYHQVGGKMVADIFESHGWNGYFIGAHTSTEALMEEARNCKPDAFAFSVTVPLGLARLEETLAAVSAAYPKAPLLIGGKALADCPERKWTHFPQARVLLSLQELEAFIREFPDDK